MHPRSSAMFQRTVPTWVAEVDPPYPSIFALTFHGGDMKSSMQLVIEVLHPLSMMSVCESESNCMGEDVCILRGVLKTHVLVRVG